MKNKKSLLVLLLTIMLPVALYAAQNNKDKSHYMAGAVPVVNGKVVFSKEFKASGLEKNEIYNRMLGYLTNRMAKSDSQLSRVVYSDKDKGTIAAFADEWMVFSSSSFSLDRTRISYQIIANCSDGKCDVSINRISYLYQDKDKYTAEAWITDDIAMNKNRTKIYPGLSKWRIKTIDLMDTYFKEILDTLGMNSNSVVETDEGGAPKKADIVSARTTVGASKNNGVAETATTKSTSTNYDFNLLYTSKILVVIGDDVDNNTTITAKSATVGQFEGKPVIFTYFDAPQTALDNATKYTVRFIKPDTRAVLKEIKCHAIKGSQEQQGMHVYEAQIEQ